MDARPPPVSAVSSRRLLVFGLLVGVLAVYVPLALVTTVVLAADGAWRPLVVAFVGLVALVVAALWTWLGEARTVAAQAVSIAALLALSAAFFVVERGPASSRDPLSVVAGVIGAAAALTFLASGRSGGTQERRTRVALGVACLLLALHLAVLHPLDWLLPVGTWGLAAAVVVARAVLTHPGDQVAMTIEAPASG